MAKGMLLTSVADDEDGGGAAAPAAAAAAQVAQPPLKVVSLGPRAPDAVLPGGVAALVWHAGDNDGYNDGNGAHGDNEGSLPVRFHEEEGDAGMAAVGSDDDADDAESTPAWTRTRMGMG